jgi:hypothetical protein
MADSDDYTARLTVAVTGVAMGNFAVTANGITGTSVTSVSGAGTTWTVTVNTGRGTGTLRLDVANGTGIVDASNIALHGTPFTGQTYDIDKGGTVDGGGAGTDGLPVPGFGNGGYALFGDVPIVSASGAIVVLADGRILVAGAVGCDAQTNECSMLQLARYLATGAPDASFGTNGRVMTSVTNIGAERSASTSMATGRSWSAATATTGPTTCRSPPSSRVEARRTRLSARTEWRR